ncbi:hypothetical protein CALVIDRAFT_483665, partial [Calocera viscosa TUFC12733]
MLLDHRCTSSCVNSVYFVFSAVRVQRLAPFPGRHERVGSAKRKAVAEAGPRKRAKIGLVVEAANDCRFPPEENEELVNSIIREYQHRTSPAWLTEVACAACGEKVSKGLAHKVSVVAVPFYLLRPDEGFPPHLYPATYSVTEYDGAFLHPKGMSSLWRKDGYIMLCDTCRRDLVLRKVMPALALCNRFYYGHEHLSAEVKAAFGGATFVDLRLVARYSASNVCFTYKDDPAKDGLFGNRVSGAQKYCRGNTVILPRDHVRMEEVLPPSADVVRTAFTTVFASGQRLDEKAIRKLAPLKACSGRVRLLLRFLMSHNDAYTGGAQGEGPVAFSDENVASIFGDGGGPLEGGNEGLPECIEIGHLRTVGHDMASDVGGRNEFADSGNSAGEFYMEACGFVKGDVSSEKYRSMKAECLQHCLGGKPFLLSRGGAVPERERHNHLLLGGLFPHLDPFNIGGFDHPARRRKVDMARQVSHLLNLYDGPFERDAQFAFVYHNILQKRRSTIEAFFRVREPDLARLMEEIKAVSPAVFGVLSSKLLKEPNYRPDTAEEIMALRVMERINVVRRDAPGTNGYKRARRNEIRALIHKLGVPAFYITVTPTDIDSGLVRLLSGECEDSASFDRGETYGSKFQRAARVSRNPAAAARSFHQTMVRFIDIVLRYGKGEGLLGTCTGVYGMVEAQGRGTLHCHMLVWLRGNLNPQAMRNRLRDDGKWRERMFKWLERHIHCELPGMRDVLKEKGGPCHKPKHLPDEINPCTLPGPSISQLMVQDFKREYFNHVSLLVEECNWHEHKATCFSRLKKGQEKGDSTCRMGIDGSTRAETGLDDQTGAILLRRLHPRINEYNDVMMFLLKCNMDIQFIGSGEGAKAAIYYITDYITKPSLPTHVGLSALGLALQKTQGEMFDLDNQGEKLLLNRLVNSMMSQQEMSHQQIMSYYVGGGDVYCRHRFTVLHWGSFDRLVRCYEARREEEVALVADGEHREDEAGLEDGLEHGFDHNMETHSGWVRDPEYLVSFQKGSVSAGNQEVDYRERPDDDDFDQLCLYDFVASTYKETRKQHEWPSVEPLGMFRVSHPQRDSHQLRLSLDASVPVILGPTLPRGDRSLDERTRWCRAMLILFKPWRALVDLLQPDESWDEAFERFSF